MKYNTLIEELEIQTNEDRLNENFRKYLVQVFSPIYVKKIDRVFKTPLKIEEFNKSDNVMAFTQGNQISISKKVLDELPTEKAMVYIFHEFLHVLQNLKSFAEVKKLNDLLRTKTMKKISVDKINQFLTGKEQNIHSDYKDEFLTYCSNGAFDWSICPELKQTYYETLKNSGIFNMESDWWKYRFGSIEVLDKKINKMMDKKIKEISQEVK